MLMQLLHVWKLEQVMEVIEVKGVIVITIFEISVERVQAKRKIDIGRSKIH
jgi:hypothetical protein